MRRARGLALLLLAAVALDSPARAGKSSFDLINGIGLIDYAARPKLKVGSWVSYQVTGHSELGESNDYKVTLLIAGEERFWGEDCFWVETWTEPKGGLLRTIATLMSYDVFSDSFPNLRSQYYSRKTIEGMNPDATLREEVTRVPATTLKKRQAMNDGAGIKVDTLGMETVTTASGTYPCRVVKWTEAKSATVDQRDSSVTTERWETRVMYFSNQVPVTGLVRESIDNTFKRRSWAVGRSKDAAPDIIMDRALGEAVLTGFGEGLKSDILPPERSITLRDIDAAEGRGSKPARARPAPKPAPARKS